MSAKTRNKRRQRKQSRQESEAASSAVAEKEAAASAPSPAPKSTNFQQLNEATAKAVDLAVGTLYGLERNPSPSNYDVVWDRAKADSDMTYFQYVTEPPEPDIKKALYAGLYNDPIMVMPKEMRIVSIDRINPGIEYPPPYMKLQPTMKDRNIMEYTMKQNGLTEPSISIRLKTGKRLDIDGKMLRVAMRGPAELVQMLEYVLTETQGDIEQTGNQNLKQQIAQLQQLSKNLQGQLTVAGEEIQRMQSGPAVYATVLKIKDKEKRVSIVMGGKKCEVKAPENIKLRPGASVLISPENMAIFSMDDDDIISGEIATLKTVNGMTGEIERAGTARAIALCGPAEPGDRVVVDDTGSIALAILGPPTNTAIFGESTGVQWDDVGGLTEAKRHMRDAIEGPFKNADKFAKFGKKPTRGVLLFGPPGCGKTMLGKAAATALADLHGAKAKGGFYYVKGPELLDMYVGNTEANIRKMFEDARRHQKKNGFPAVIFLDEADAILGKRGERGVGMNTTVVPQFLSEMDGLEESGAIVIIATNRPETLDPAIVRDGRIDRRILVSRPTQLDVVAIAEKAIAKKPIGFGTAQNLAACLARDVFDEKLAIAKVFRRGKTDPVNLTLGHTVNGAMVVGVVERATAIAMHKEADWVDETHIQGAVVQAFNEALDVNHDDDVLDLCQGFTGDVTRIERGERIAA